MTMFKDGFTVSKGSQNFAKITLGENRFRILAPPLTGYVGWADKKPFRSEMMTSRKFDDPVKPVMIFLIWSYAQREIQILEVTQRTVQQKIFELSKDPDWGDAYHYDIKISKSGNGMSTKYDCAACPKTPVTDEIKKAAAEKPCNLRALFTGGDPWKVEDGQVTELALDELPF